MPLVFVLCTHISINPRPYTASAVTRANSIVNDPPEKTHPLCFALYYSMDFALDATKYVFSGTWKCVLVKVEVPRGRRTSIWWVNEWTMSVCTRRENYYMCSEQKSGILNTTSQMRFRALQSHVELIWKVMKGCYSLCLAFVLCSLFALSSCRTAHRKTDSGNNYLRI